MSLINREVLLSFEKMDADLCATCGEHHTAEDVIMMIKTAPTVDAVPVVRCRECKHHGNINAYTGTRFDFKFCNKFGNVTRENDFCSYGDRKEGAG